MEDARKIMASIAHLEENWTLVVLKQGMYLDELFLVTHFLSHGKENYSTIFETMLHSIFVIFRSANCNAAIYRSKHTNYVLKINISTNSESIIYISIKYVTVQPVTVAARSKAWNVFARSDARIVGPNPTQGMDVWCVYAFILCLCCPVFR
jgi:hypothetical protein